MQSTARTTLLSSALATLLPMQAVSAQNIQADSYPTPNYGFVEIAPYVYASAVVASAKTPEPGSREMRALERPLSTQQFSITADPVNPNWRRDPASKTMTSDRAGAIPTGIVGGTIGEKSVAARKDSDAHCDIGCVTGGVLGIVATSVAGLVGTMTSTLAPALGGSTAAASAAGAIHASGIAGAVEASAVAGTKGAADVEVIASTSGGGVLTATNPTTGIPVNAAQILRRTETIIGALTSESTSEAVKEVAQIATAAGLISGGVAGAAVAVTAVAKALMAQQTSLTPEQAGTRTRTLTTRIRDTALELLPDPYISKLQGQGPVMLTQNQNIRTKFRFYRTDGQIDMQAPVLGTATMPMQTREVLKTGFGTDITSKGSNGIANGTKWINNSLPFETEIIDLANGKKGTAAVRIDYSDLAVGRPVLVSSGELSGCTMMFGADKASFYAFHAGTSIACSDWTTAKDGAESIAKAAKALGNKEVDVTNLPANQILTTLAGKFHASQITYNGKFNAAGLDTRLSGSLPRGAWATDYFDTDAHKPVLGNAMALLTKSADGTVKVRFLSEKGLLFDPKSVSGTLNYKYRALTSHKHTYKLLPAS